MDAPTKYENIIQCYQIADFSIIGLFSIAPCKVIATNLLCFFLVLLFASFLGCPLYIYLFFIIAVYSDSDCYFSPLEAIAKSFFITFRYQKSLQNEGLAFNEVKLIFE